MNNGIIEEIQQKVAKAHEYAQWVLNNRETLCPEDVIAKAAELVKINDEAIALIERLPSAVAAEKELLKNTLRQQTGYCKASIDDALDYINERRKKRDGDDHHQEP